MCEHGCRASHNEGHDGLNIRPKQLRNREVPWEGSQGSKRMSRRTERPYKVDGADKLARSTLLAIPSGLGGKRQRTVQNLRTFGAFPAALASWSAAVLCRSSGARTAANGPVERYR